jgi:hypothetical protein
VTGKAIALFSRLTIHESLIAEHAADVADEIAKSYTSYYDRSAIN